MFKIGDVVFFIDRELKTINSGLVVGTHLHTSGHIGFAIRTLVDGKDKVVRLEKGFVFGTLADAEYKIEEYRPIQAKMAELIKACDKEVDALRIKIIGEVDFPELAMEG